MTIKSILFLVIALPLLAAGCNSQMSGPTPEASTQQQNQNEVVIQGYEFSPKELVVKKGTTVTWRNKDEAKHTVTASGAQGPKSELFGQGESYSYTFNEVGAFGYYCEPHPYMKGMVKVE